MLNEYAELNCGIGEGASYRGRVLLSIRTEMTDSVENVPSEVEVEPTAPISEVRIETSCLKGLICTSKAHLYIFLGHTLSYGI